jgi:two-component system, OmpR family, sensor histidine kinase MprB
MTLRRRLAIVAASTVGVAIVLAAMVCYVVVRGQLRGQIDSELTAQATLVQQGDYHSLNEPVPSIPASAGGPAPYAQWVASDGTSGPGGADVIPVDSHAMQVARGTADSYFGDVRAGGSHLRVLTVPLPQRTFVNGVPESVALQLARPLNGVDRILAHLRLVLLLLCLGGIGLAAALGRVAARRVLSPLAEVTDTAVQISETDDLSRRLRIHADDEVGQLARRFNQMLEHLQRSRAELDESVRSQRQLVADASHELRTPVTSLRTNIEVLLDGGQLSEEDRRRLLADVVEQSEELSGLVGDLIELARGDLPAGATEETRLDRIVDESLARARRNYAAVEFQASLVPIIVEGVPERLGRAINNLLDNAARHSPPGSVVEVLVDPGGVRVRDHGRGIEAEDLPHVFDRFYRGANSRGQQGSGLGLAIVRQVAQQHRGSVSATNAGDGGAIFTLHLPGTAVGSGSDAYDRDVSANAPEASLDAPAARP